MPRRLRVALVTLGWHGNGGIERCVMAEAAWLRARGHDVHVFAPSFGAPVPAGVAAHPVPVPARPWLRKLRAFFQAAPRAVEAAGPFDVVHAHTVYGGTGHLAHAHSVHRQAVAWDAPAGSLAKLWWWLKGLPPVAVSLSDQTYRGARAVLSISGRIRAELKESYGLDGAGTPLLYYGVEHERFKPLSAAAKRRARAALKLDGFWGVFCGWNWRRKGLDVLLGALPDAPSVNLLVVGEDPEEGAAFRRLARELGVAERVRFEGRQSEPERYFQAADAFAFPTRYEPFGMVVSEAMACGLPVLVPAGIGAAEVLPEKGKGQALAPDAGPEAWAWALNALQARPAYAKALGAKNCKAVRRLTWAEHGRNLEKIYLTTLTRTKEQA
jgi:UDP-glucose:(heptosyl)LPS alpha-1,3-glucosyltransferase